MTKTKLLLIAACACLLSCKPHVTPGALYGKWRYIKIEHTSHTQPDLDEVELKRQDASIEFLKDNHFTIMWGGQPLSRGEFTVSEDKIRITETLPDNTTRQFLFYVTELSDKQIVFETKTGDNPKVTAVRE